MAANDARVASNPPCLICMETPVVLKVLPTCRHAFCSKCLTSHVKKYGEASKTFPCPSCKSDCPLPEDGVSGLHDHYAVDNAEDDRTNQSTSRRSGVTCNTDEVTMCEICHYDKNKDSPAEHLCEECGLIYLCRQCAHAHGKNKITATHVLISLKKRAEGCCKKHRKVINKYCSTCSEPCCHMCILLAHEDHEIVGLVEVFNTLVDDVKTKAEEQLKRSDEVKSCAGQLEIIKSSTLAQRKELLVQEIENHAELHINEITNQKEALKDQVEDTYKLLTLVSEDLEKAASIGKLDDALVQVDTVLSGATPTPMCVQKLLSVKQEISKYEIRQEIDIEKYWDSYTTLLDKSVRFAPKTPSYRIGDLEIKNIIPAEKAVEKLTNVIEQKLNVDHPVNFVPSVSIIDNDFYAIAHPALGSKPSGGFDIYKFPAVFHQTIKEHADSLHDMAVFPDGKLAVLGRGSTQESSSAHLFHPVTGYMKSTEDFPIREPLSFDVNTRHQFVILSADGGRRVTVCNEDGSVELEQQVDGPHGINDAFRIACSRKYVYIIGRKRLAVFEAKNKKLYLVTSSKDTFRTFYLTDISVTESEQVTVLYRQAAAHGVYWFGRYVLRYNKLVGPYSLQIYNENRYTEARLSTRNDYIVCTQGGSMLRVFKESD